jgi:hypothetical protein
MPKGSKKTASDSMQVEGYEGHYENFDGGYTVAFETFTVPRTWKRRAPERCRFRRRGST